jgi:hypothetical protein
MGADYKAALTWPVLTWIVLDVYFFAISYLSGVLDALEMAEPVIWTVGAAVGFWAGWAIVDKGGKWADPIVAGLIVGVVCAGGGYVLFGLVRGLFTELTPATIFDFSFNLGGAIIGGWWNLSRKGAPMMGG